MHTSRGRSNKPRCFKLSTLIRHIFIFSFVLYVAYVVRSFVILIKFTEVSQNNHSFSSYIREAKRSFMLNATELSSPSTSTTDSSLISTDTNTSYLDDKEPISSKKDTFLYIHIGPPKTGTTSLQCNLSHNKFLPQDSYHYIGQAETRCEGLAKIPKENFFADIHTPLKSAKRFTLYLLGKKNDIPFYPDGFKELLQQNHEKGIDTIISGEYLEKISRDDIPFKRLTDILLELPQKVQFVVTHRYFFDWKQSFYNWITLVYFGGLGYKQKKFMEFQGESMVSIIDNRGFTLSKIFANDTITPYNTWNNLNMKLQLLNKQYNGTIADKFSISVINFHGSDMSKDLGTTFICMLPHASYSCNKTRKLEFGKSRPTQSNKLHSDRIAAAAWEEKLFYNATAVKKKRNKVNKAINHYIIHELKVTYTDLPLECLGDDIMNILLNMSIRHGKEMLGDKFDLDDLNKRFNAAVVAKKFCSINTTALLMDESWRQFLSREDLLLSH